MNVIFFVIISSFAVTLFNSVAVACPKVTYNELKDIGASCAPEDTCSEPRNAHEDIVGLYRCQCKASCIKSNTCCIDSDFVTFGVIHSRTKTGTCQRVFNSNLDVIMVSKCESRWRGNRRVKSMCENPSNNLNDPISLTPVTNRNSETTYSNYYCAVCNYDVQFLEIWDIKVTRIVSSVEERNRYDTDQEKLASQLVFDERTKSWGLNVVGPDRNVDFQPVDIGFEIPQRVKEIVTKCSTDLVSECDYRWTDVEVRRKCRAYMAIVYLAPNVSNTLYTLATAYRNVHCAICNYESYTPETICKTYRVPSSADRPPLSFTLLLDVNLGDGDKVGEIDNCGKGKMFDPFFKKCRTLVCGLPGHVLKDNKCVPA